MNSRSDVESLLLQLKARDVRVWAEDGRLRVSAAKGAADAALREELAARKEELLAFLQAAERQPRTAIPRLDDARRADPLPLSFQQERMWYLHQFDPWSTAYTLQTRLFLQADPAVLEQAWNRVVSRHEILRTRYAATADGPVQRIEPVVAAGLAIVDLADLPEAARRSALLSHAQAAVRQPFDLARGPVWRIIAFRLDAHGQLAVFLFVHHIAADGWSLARLNAELAATCAALAAGRVPLLPTTDLQYADYAVWQRERLRAAELERLSGWWRERLADLGDTRYLRPDMQRPATLARRGAALAVELPAEICLGLRELAQRHRVTTFTVQLAVFKLLLHHLSGRADIVVGTPVLGRDRPELDEVQGSFVNVLVLRTDLSGDPPFATLLGRVRETTVEAFAQGEMPFEKLVDALPERRDLGRKPLFQVMFNQLIAASLGDTGKRATAETGQATASGEGQAQFDLALDVRETDTGTTLLLSYGADLFRSETIGQLARWYLDLAAVVIADPGRPLSAYAPAGVEPGRAHSEPDPGPRQRGEAGYTAPQTEAERVLAQVWSEVLGLDRVGVDDNFFDLGGDSLLAMKTFALFRERTGRSLDARNFFQQTLGQIAASVERPGGETRPRPRFELEPFFFGSDARPLFGLLRRAIEPLGAGIVLAQPHAHEYIRCHRAFRSLAQRLAHQGFDVLAFDFYGMGDSGGEYEDGTPSGWAGDLDAAIDALRERARAHRIGIVGLRLGATLAARVAARRTDITALALWDPVVRGPALAAEYADYAALQALDPLRQRDVAYSDVLAYPVTDSMMAAIGGIDLVAELRTALPRALVVETDPDGTGHELAAHLQAIGSEVLLRRIDEARVWLREPYEAVVPQRVSAALTDWAKQVLA